MDKPPANEAVTPKITETSVTAKEQVPQQVENESSTTTDLTIMNNAVTEKPPPVEVLKSLHQHPSTKNDENSVTQVIENQVSQSENHAEIPDRIVIENEP